MLFSLPVSLLMILGVTFGLAWPLAARLTLPPVEKLVASAALSLLGVFLLAWAVYVCAWPVATLWALPGFAAAGFALGRRELAVAWRDADTRAILLGQLLVTGWCVGWLATIASYSGGGWAGDWFEHWERARFFIERWPVDRKFLATYPLPARPPLANVVTGAFLVLTRVDFAHYQLVSTLLGSLVFLPATLLARRFRPHPDVAGPVGGGRGAMAVLAVLLMLNPLFVQNATFAWTKLPAAFFVLVALHFFLRAHDSGAPRAAAPLFAATLAAGLLAHYSTGPYAVMLGGAWLTLGWPHRRDAAWWRGTALATLVGGLVLATWFGWSLAVYGTQGTFFSNSSVTAGEAHHGNQFVKIALNLFDTLIPHFLRPLDMGLIAQRSAWGWWRDYFFSCYQLNLPLAFGSVAWCAILRELVRAAGGAARRARVFWGTFIAGVVFLGVATHGARDEWGLAHICLQPLVLAGLAFLAARWPLLGPGWRRAFIAGATVDFMLGVVLHFGAQSFLLDRWLTPGRTPGDVLTSYNEIALLNLRAKVQAHFVFFGDALAAPPALVLAVLAAIFMLALTRTRARR
jgi:hypothetical protein